MEQVRVRYFNGYETLMKREVAEILMTKKQLVILDDAPKPAEEVRLPEIERAHAPAKRGGMRGIRPKA